MATGYRAFPPKLLHPSRARRYSVEDFQALDKAKLQTAPSFCNGHKETVIWYAKSVGYIVEVQFEKHDPIFIHSICTFTPTHGMDKIDGEFTQDAEALLLQEVLGLETHRLDVYGTEAEISIEPYLRSRGAIK